MTENTKKAGWRARAVALQLVLAVGAASAGDDLPARDVLLRPDPQALATLELSLAAMKGVAPRRVGFEDFLLRIESVANVAIEDTLLMPNIDAHVQGTTVATVDLIGVVKGRAIVARRLQCGPWSGDSLRCASTCDGSQIAITRRLGKTSRGPTAGEPPEQLLSLIIGRFDPGNDRHADGGVAFGACQNGEAPPARLLAKSKGPFVEIPLKTE